MTMYLHGHEAIMILSGSAGLITISTSEYKLSKLQINKLPFLLANYLA